MVPGAVTDPSTSHAAVCACRAPGLFSDPGAAGITAWRCSPSSAGRDDGLPPFPGGECRASSSRAPGEHQKVPLVQWGRRGPCRRTWSAVQEARAPGLALLAELLATPPGSVCSAAKQGGRAGPEIFQQLLRAWASEGPSPGKQRGGQWEPLPPDAFPRAL